jgi:aldose 1-epimerase
MAYEINRRSLLVASAAVLAGGCESVKQIGESMTTNAVTVAVEPFGEIDGQRVDLYTFTHQNGTVVKITNYGAIVTSLLVKDRDGKLADVALGCDTLADYVAGHPYFGCIAGRCANRIAKGQFSLDGKDYQLACNNGENHLHGGVKGFDKQVWTALPVAMEGGRGLQLTLVSKDGDENYPGTLTTTVRYLLTKAGELAIDMRATTDAPTLCNLVHHTYWNLAGHDSGRVDGHELELRARRYTPTGASLVPTGELASVAGTPFDFTQRKVIGKDLGVLAAEPNAGHGGGYDLNYVVDDFSGELQLVAAVRDPKSGRKMEVLSNQPGLQFYTGNFIKDQKGKGTTYQQYAGFCLESQVFPDAIHHAHFPSAVLRPGQVYHHEMIHRFSVE